MQYYILQTQQATVKATCLAHTVHNRPMASEMPSDVWVMWSKVSFGAKWAAALSDQLKKGMKMRKTRIHLDTLKKVRNKTERELSACFRRF